MKHSSSAVLRRVGVVPLACVIGAVLIVAIAGIAWNTSPYYGRDDRVAAAAPDTAPVPSVTGTYRAALAPTRIDIPRLKATARIVEVATSPDGELEIPKNPKIVGWWSPGAKPGARKGTAVLSSHINYAGVTGTFASIGKLHKDDVVDVYGKYNARKTKVRFRVTAVRTYHKTALPYRQIFDQKIAGRIALVTCGGPFDAATGNYLDNIVVYGVAT
ncbi:Sortase family protein [Jatrophihabitans endophyticus]|uniref:Sortase family protein n=1 Tax=Jatrophihabitans endophyticus TaxID=1206085 RepID=A0A1M5GJA4_9ACTN|nr:class F sortase [Jatrophihabitans endophyticus]SHG03601.1 Sortase family protein [Jatrophihabitans endophyticus]